jgi:hypothetical protein
MLLAAQVSERLTLTFTSSSGLQSLQAQFAAEKFPGLLVTNVTVGMPY